MKCRWCPRVFSLDEWRPTSLTMHHPLPLFPWCRRSAQCKDAMDAAGTGPTAVALQGCRAGSILLLLAAVAISHPTLWLSSGKVWKRGIFSHSKELDSWDCSDLLNMGALQSLVLGMPQWATLISALNQQGAWKLGNLLDFSAVDYKWSTKPYFPGWPAWLSLLLEAATLLFKKWTNLWRRRNKMSLANCVVLVKWPALVRKTLAVINSERLSSLICVAIYESLLPTETFKSVSLGSLRRNR